MFEHDIGAQLRETSHLRGEQRDAHLRKLAAEVATVVHYLPELARSSDKGSIVVAIEVMSRVPFPGTAAAVPYLAGWATDPNLPGAQLAIDVLGHMPAEAVAPSLIQLLLDRGKTNRRWNESLYGVCAMLLELDRSVAELCGPTIAYLLGQSALYDRLDAKILLEVLAKIGPESVMYAIPPLIALAHEHASAEVRSMATRILQRMPPAGLHTYSIAGTGSD